MTIVGHRLIVGVWLTLGLLLCTLAYAPGLQGGFMFDDFPNIVDNHGIQPDRADIPSLITAALSSPSSDLKRPLASLSFAANFLTTGLAPGPMKVTNLVIHLLNGLAAFFVVRRLLILTVEPDLFRASIGAVLIATTWLLLPINVTSVLYVVQRMESMANLFVLLGLWGYLAARMRMLRTGHGITAAIASILGGTILGVLVKETAVMTPLYAAIIEAFILRARSRQQDNKQAFDWRLPAFYVVVLVMPLLLGSIWLLPRLLSPTSWANRDFTLSTRLLSEARIVLDYIGWTFLPTPSALSFYHDDFRISTGWFTPPATILAILTLLVAAAAIVALRNRRPLLVTGLAFYFGAHLLTGTILPLELIYEHRNYFPSLALILAVAGCYTQPGRDRNTSLALAIPMCALALYASLQTAITAYAWRSPLNLAKELSDRAPRSPRAQYELGRAYIIDSHYNPTSPSVALAYPPLERAAALPQSTILPLQALLFFNARLGLPLKEEWWVAIIEKLKARRPGVEDESSLIALTQCIETGGCSLPKDRMRSAFEAAITHPNPSARLLAAYADFAWNVLGDKGLGRKLIKQAAAAAPNEAAYRITLVRFEIGEGRDDDAKRSLAALEDMNFGGRLSGTIQRLRQQIEAADEAASDHE